MVGLKKDVIKWLCDAPDGEYKAEPFKQKRSLPANSYYWTLLAKLAQALRTSKPELHNLMLRRYGQYLKDPDGNVVAVLLQKNVKPDKMEGVHLEFYDEFRGMARYKVIQGSHTYDSREMAALLDGLIDECKQAGIETLPPYKLKELKGYEQTK